MTYKEMVLKHLDGLTIFPDEAELIWGYACGKMDVEVRWDKELGWYPDSFSNIILVSIDVSALEWLKKYKPNHLAIQILNRL